MCLAEEKKMMIFLTEPKEKKNDDITLDLTERKYSIFFIKLWLENFLREKIFQPKFYKKNAIFSLCQVQSNIIIFFFPSVRSGISSFFFR